jgi:hypothetical protein
VGYGQFIASKSFFWGDVVVKREDIVSIENISDSISKVIPQSDKVKD